MMLASGGKAIASLAKAIGLMTGASAAADGTGGAAGKLNPATAALGTVVATQVVAALATETARDQLKAKTGVNYNIQVGGNIALPSGTKGDPTGLRGAFGKKPKLADGGLVMPRPGGMDVTVAEAGQPEAIIPLNKMASMGVGGGATYNITVNAGAGANGGSIGTEIVNAIKAFERSNGKGWRS
jgi:hypothetical protein